jgi:hypothetical protein
LLGSYVIKCSDIGLEPKKNAPQVISPPIQQLLILSDGQISRLVAHIAGKSAPFVIGDAHIISKTGQVAYREFIIMARAAAELAQTPYCKTMSEIRVAARLAKEKC